LTIFPILTPLVDFLRVALGSATLRPLITPVEFVEIVASGAGSDINIEFLLKESSNTRKCPEIALKAMRFCSP